jgi:hypothetical protein
MNDNLINWLESLTEPDTYPLIRDLLVAMGFRQVVITHGQLEFGRDICFVEHDRIGRQIWRGVQVKTSALSGSLCSEQGARHLLSQCEAALDTPFELPDGTTVMLKEIWIVTTHQLTEHAKASIRGKLSKLPSIQILDGPAIRDLIERHLPSLLDAQSEPLERYLQYLVNYCNSPEEYLVTRVRAKWSVADVFYDPECTIRILHPESYSNAQLLPKLDRVLDRADYLKTMLAKRLLPLAEVNLLIEVIESLIRLLVFLKAIGSSRSRCASLEASIPLLVADLAGLRIDQKQLNPLQPMRELLTPIIETSALYRLEPFLATINDESTEVLRRYTRLLAEVAQLERCQIESASTKAANTVVESLASAKMNLDRASESRMQFFDALRVAYISGTDFSHPLVKIATLAASNLWQSIRVHAFAKPQSLSEVKTLVRESEGDIKSKYNQMWMETVEPHIQKGKAESADERIMEAWGILNQLSVAMCDLFELKNVKWIELTSSGLLICQACKRLVIKGDLGIGKTTLLKRASQIEAEKYLNNTETLVPILVLLSTVSDAGNAGARDILLSSVHTKFRMLNTVRDENMHWVLDGVDELKSIALREKIFDWCVQNKSLRILLSSRPHAIPQWMPGFTVVSMEPMSQESAERLVQNFSRDNPAMQKKLIDALRSSVALSELARNPLMLMLLIIMAMRRGAETLPTRREDLYEEIMDLLLGEWDKVKSVEREHLIHDRRIRRRLFQRIAFTLYAKRKRNFTKEEFLDATMSAIPLIGVTYDMALELFEEVLRDCIVIPITSQEYGFFHFSIQEFLTAEDLANDTGLQRVWQVVEEYFRSNGWWEGVLVFYAGIKRDVSYLINNLEKHLTIVISGDCENTLLRGILERWRKAADFMRWEDIRPHGTVAKVLSNEQEGSRWKLGKGSPFK